MRKHTFLKMRCFKGTKLKNLKDPRTRNGDNRSSLALLLSGFLWFFILASPSQPGNAHQPTKPTRPARQRSPARLARPARPGRPGASAKPTGPAKPTRLVEPSEPCHQVSQASQLTQASQLSQASQARPSRPARPGQLGTIRRSAMRILCETYANLMRKKIKLAFWGWGAPRDDQSSIKLQCFS